MCLIVFAWQAHAEHRLVLAGNRDEYHRRPTQPLGWWPDSPQLLAGRDLQAGGTWLGLTRNGRFAAVTNYRERARDRAGRLSRGALVTDFLQSSATPAAFVEALDGQSYAGFTLLAGDAQSMCVVSNRGDAPRILEPGIYGLSNAALDTPWPKLVRCRDGLQALLERNAVNATRLLELLADTTPAQASAIEAGDLPFAEARALSAPFICMPDYGTRCSTAAIIGNDGQSSMVERRFAADGSASGDAEFRFQVTPGKAAQAACSRP